jgi:hypothetical protein
LRFRIGRETRSARSGTPRLFAERPDIAAASRPTRTTRFNRRESRRFDGSRHGKSLVERVFRKFLSDILCVASHSPFVIHAGRKKSKKELGIIKEFRSDEKIPPIRPKPSRQLSLPSDSPISRKKTQPERIAQAAGSSLSKSILRLLHF